MKPSTILRSVAMSVLLGAAALAQNPPSLTQKILVPGGPPMVRKEAPKAPEKQDEALANHQKNLEDVAAIQQLAKEIEQTLKEPGNDQASADSLKKSDEIEKLAKRMKARLRRASRK